MDDREVFRRPEEHVRGLLRTFPPFYERARARARLGSPQASDFFIVVIPFSQAARLRPIPYRATGTSISLFLFRASVCSLKTRDGGIVKRLSAGTRSFLDTFNVKYTRLVEIRIIIKFARDKTRQHETFRVYPGSSALISCTFARYLH